MFRIESYVTPILLSYVDKYVKDFKPADAQVSLWGGGVALHNLVLKADVLQQEVSLPFNLVSGRIHELLIQVPWTKIMSEPIVITIDTIECVLSLRPPAEHDESPAQDQSSRKGPVVEAPPGYMQALVRRIVSNISLKIHHLIVKYVEDDIVLSLNVKYLSVDSADTKWAPSFADIDQALPVVRRLVQLDDLTLCLDRADADGKIRFYQEPVLYRCQLNLRVATRLVSANTRRATEMNVQLSSSRLAWGITTDQLTLVLRLLRNRTPDRSETPSTSSNIASPTTASLGGASGTTDAGGESWSEWAWSWLPSLSEQEGPEEVPPAPAPLPIHFTACLDSVAVVFKVMEVEANGRKKTRGVLEFSAGHAAVKGTVCAPTSIQVFAAARTLLLKSTGRCVCGNLSSASDEPTVYLSRLNAEEDQPWKWPEEAFENQIDGTTDVAHHTAKSSETLEAGGHADQPASATQQHSDNHDDSTSDYPHPLWQKMEPVIFIQYSHERSPFDANVNPYESPPKDFEYSDWVESCAIKVKVLPLEFRLCMGLIHRVAAIQNIFRELPPAPVQEIPVHVLTVEECEALTDNLPQRQLDVQLKGFRVMFIPFDHDASERSGAAKVALQVDLARVNGHVTGPLYPIRVCSAACQIQRQTGPIWHGARQHITASVSGAQAVILPLEGSAGSTRPVARADLRIVAHLLLHQQMFNNKEAVCYSYSFNIKEANVCGSAARLQAALEIVKSLQKQRQSLLLQYTSLISNALSDEESVAIDVTLEEMSLRGYITKNIYTNILTLISVKATMFHKKKDEPTDQAWIFSGPDIPTQSPFIRMAGQYCLESSAKSLDYFGFWSEPMALSMDPLLIAWLAYKPKIVAVSEPSRVNLVKSVSSAAFINRHRYTSPVTSSSGRGASRGGSAREQVHSARPRSLGSGSERSKEPEPPPVTAAHPHLEWTDEGLISVYGRLRRLLLNVELGLVCVYFSRSTASALDCATLRDAVERHAAASRPVLALSFGHFKMHCSNLMKYLWQEVRYDGPTFEIAETKFCEEDSFPWKMKIADLSCYTLEVQGMVADKSGREKATSTLRSRLKAGCVVAPRAVLELVTTSITLSVVTKTLQKKEHKTSGKDEEAKPQKSSEPTPEENRIRYFTSGHDFKPTTLQEFVRGPVRRTKKEDEVKPEPVLERPKTPPKSDATGPIVSIGVHLHADTPPVILRLDQDQVHMVGTALHSVEHMVALLRREPLVIPHRRGAVSLTSIHRLVRSVSELEEQQSDETITSENKSEQLISIFDPHTVPVEQLKLKTFLWFQWVISHLTLVVASDSVKLVFNVDDIINTVDLHPQYNQLKVKVASASIKHFERNGTDEWKAAVLGGRVLEAREVTSPQDESTFLGVTITQARISTLPDSWKEELHPKVLQCKAYGDTMWEIYATLAPLEAVLRPIIVEDVVTLLTAMSPRTNCPLHLEDTTVQQRKWQWPYIYVAAGGLRLLLYSEESKFSRDDTLVLNIGKVDINPHPENPICRKAVSVTTEAGWTSAGGGIEGRQYEIFIRNISVDSAQFAQIVKEELSDNAMKSATGGENPALKWAQPLVAAITTPVLHSLQITCVCAPAITMTGALVWGPAFELNLASDCAIELSVDQLELANNLAYDLSYAMEHKQHSFISLHEHRQDECPYVNLFGDDDDDSDTFSLKSFAIDLGRVQSGASISSRNIGDSGVDSNTNISSFRKKSVGFAEDGANPMDYLEVFVTMGVIEVSLYVLDNKDDARLDVLRPPDSEKPILDEEKNDSEQSSEMISDSVASLTQDIRNKSIVKTVMVLARQGEGQLPLIHLSLQQPNLYYFVRKSQKHLQVSLFNAWLGLGSEQTGQLHWNAPLLTTAKGVPDPITEIPPALVTMKLVTHTPGSSNTNISGPRGLLKIEVERPVDVEISSDRLKRLKMISRLVSAACSRKTATRQPPVEDVAGPALYRLHKFMKSKCIDTITVTTTQVGVRGECGAAGWADASLQVAAGGRSSRLVARALVSALLVSVGSPIDNRHPLLMPVTLGMELEAAWESWRRAEGGASALEPTIKACLELDRITIDLRPQDYSHLNHIMHTIDLLTSTKSRKRTLTADHPSSPSDHLGSIFSQKCSVKRSASTESEPSDTYYKDDLRSGAFKLVTGKQIPMAYQVIVHEAAVSWRYPHPRAVTRLVAFPLPNLEEEVDCVLEHYSGAVSRWEPLVFFKLPIMEPSEIHLTNTPPEAVFAIMWRCRLVQNRDFKHAPFEFQPDKFTPKQDPLTETPAPPAGPPGFSSPVSAEQLAGSLRVDSYSGVSAPRATVALRLAALAVYLHCDLPRFDKDVEVLEGYYVTKPLMKSHRVLGFFFNNATAIAQTNPAYGTLGLLHGDIETEVLDCATGTMECLSEAAFLQAAVSARLDEEPCTRFMTSPVVVNMSVPVLRTLQMLVDDWLFAYRDTGSTSKRDTRELTKREIHSEVAEQLEGRVSVWIHNSCSRAFRVGQEGTDEVLPLSSGARLAYRWHDPNSPKRLRFALTGPSTDWQWSSSVPLCVGTNRVSLPDAGFLGAGASPGSGVFVHARVRSSAARAYLSLDGRLALANTLRRPLLFKVRIRCRDSNTWSTIISGELEPESVGRTVLCGAECELALKVKFTGHETGWSGDIPLKECPKENVPWLVKVPSAGEVPYVSVWCRVVRGRMDGRTLATIWPLYVLRSHLSLDTDVLITTESSTPPPAAASATTETESVPDRAAPLVLSASGRGAATPLPAPGTAAARHTLAFQYRNIECPVTREAIPLHYGVTETSVFDKRHYANNVDDIIQEIIQWLKLSGRTAQSGWPYSVVTSHWSGEWKPALLQPRCDVTVRYEAIRAGGGCSLEVRLCPVVVLCNASTLALTLRGHDAAPLCKLEPGAAISPSSTLLTKPFFMSLEVGRETFVSCELSVRHDTPGPYDTPPAGSVSLQRPAAFHIQCNQKVVMLTLYFEIKHEINVLGISCTYILLNKLDTDVLISAVAVPEDVELPFAFRPQSAKTIPPSEPGSVGTSLCRFALCGRWRGGVSALRAFLFVSLHADAAAVPVALVAAPARTCIALTDSNGDSVAVVVAQAEVEGRWVLSVARDPCPQFVICNYTEQPLFVAEPRPDNPVVCLPDCEGTQWRCAVRAGGRLHYATPSHRARHPVPPENLPTTSLMFAFYINEVEPSWSAPVAVVAGEHLIQFPTQTFKMRVQPHPHSTLIELLEVDYSDISASDIRKRLHGPFSIEDLKRDSRTMLRTNANETLLGSIRYKRKQRVVLEELVSKSETEQPDIPLLPLQKDSTEQLTIPEIQTENSPVTDATDKNVKTDEGNESDTKDILPVVIYDESIAKPPEILNTETPNKLISSLKGTPKSTSKRVTTSPDAKPDTSDKDSDKKTEVPLETIVDKNLDSQSIGREETLEEPPKKGSKKLSIAESPVDKLILFEIHSDYDIVSIGDPDKKREEGSAKSLTTIAPPPDTYSDLSFAFSDAPDTDAVSGNAWSPRERVRGVVWGVSVRAAGGGAPVLVLHADRLACLHLADAHGSTTTLTAAQLQVDNPQYETGQFDFAVVASTSTSPDPPEPWPALWAMFAERSPFAARRSTSKLLLSATYERWTVYKDTFHELTDIEAQLGPLSLYVEDALVGATARLLRDALPPSTPEPAAWSETWALEHPLTLRSLVIRPLDVNVTLHTAIRMYIALDQSPLRLGEFRLTDMMTSVQRLTHALTVHYLSAVLLGAGWVVGGLELLGAPGALAARVGGAGGGVRGVAAAAAAGVLRALAAAAGSLARNLDLLAGDEDHARRAAAARRHPYDTLLAALAAGLSNFAVNMLGAVGGLAHHPVVGVAVGEAGGVAGLRRGLIGAVAKPLAATADLVAYAGAGLLRQTGWDPAPQRRSLREISRAEAGWRRDCVRWSFRLGELRALSGVRILLAQAPLVALLTHKFLVVVDPDTERIVEMIDFKSCSLGPQQGQIVELTVSQRKTSKTQKIDEDAELQVSAAAMARVARYTGLGSSSVAAAAAAGGARLLPLLPPPGRSAELAAALQALLQHNAASHLPLL